MSKLKVVHGFIKEAYKQLKQQDDTCRMEYSYYGYDIVCGQWSKTYYKVKRIKPGGTIVITYSEYLDALEVFSHLYVLVVNELGKILAKIPFEKALKIYYGINNSETIVDNEKHYKLKVSIVPGRKGKAITIFLSDDEYKNIQKELEIVADPVEYLRRKLFD